MQSLHLAIHKATGSGCVEDATLTITNPPGTTLRAELYEADAKTLVELFRYTIPSGTWDRFLLKMLDFEIKGYQQRGTDYGYATAQKMMDISDVIRERLSVL